MDVVETVKQVAVSFFRSILPFSAAHNGTFKALLSVRVGDEVKPLLLIGNAHSKIEDGHCIAVLNPDMELVDSLVAGCGYERSTLKWEGAKRCGVALDVWIDAYKTDGVFVGTRYRSRNPQPAKFAVV